MPFRIERLSAARPERAFALRLALVVFLYCFFVSLEWIHLRWVVAITTATLLGALGVDAEVLPHLGGADILLPSGRYAVTAECTYVDLILVLAPLVWRQRDKLGVNTIRLGVTAVVVFLVNLARLAFALSMNNAGVSWQLSHTLPDLGIYFPSLLLVGYTALHRDGNPTLAGEGSVQGRKHLARAGPSW